MKTIIKESITNISESLFSHKVYWLNQLTGELPETNIITDYLRPRFYSDKNKSIEFKLSNSLSQTVIEIGKDSYLSIYLLLLTAFEILLKKYTGNNDLIVGIPSYEPRDGNEKLINRASDRILPLRFNVNDRLTFKDIILQIKDTVISAYTHQNYPFDELLRLLKITSSNNRCPIYDIVFLLENIHDRNNLADLNNDLTVSFLVDRNVIKGKIEYSQSLFRDETIETLAQHYINVLEGAIENLDIKVSNIDLLKENEKEKLLKGFNNNVKKYPIERTIQDLFAEQVERSPNNIAVAFQEDKLTYQELNEKANNLATFLRKLGIKKGDFVGICHKRNTNFLVSIIAILKAGGAYVPIDCTYPPERIKYMLSNSEVKILLSESSLLNILTGNLKDYRHLNSIICLDVNANNSIETKLTDVNIYSQADIDRFCEKYSIPPSRGADGVGEAVPFRLVASPYKTPSPYSRGEYSKVPLNKGDLGGSNIAQKNIEEINRGIDRAYMLYTSGSTGLPKGAIVRHDGAINHIYAQFDALELQEGFSFLQSAAASSDISVWQFLAPILRGGRTVIVDTETVCNPEKLFQVIKQEQINLVEFVPVVLKGLLDYISQLSPQQRLLPDLKWMMVTGEYVSVELVNEWLRIYPSIKVANAYGPTEAADDITQFIITEPFPTNQRSIPIGKPLANLNLYILDSQMQLVPIGVPGEICVSGIGVGDGYWQNEEKTNSSFVCNPFANPIPPAPLIKGGLRGDRLYKTGDLGRWLPDGNIEFLGRIDRQVKIRGFRIELGEIETLLTQHSSVREGVVVVREDIANDKRLVAYIVPYLEGNREQGTGNSAGVEQGFTPRPTQSSSGEGVSDSLVGRGNEQPTNPVSDRQTQLLPVAKAGKSEVSSDLFTCRRSLFPLPKVDEDSAIASEFTPQLRNFLKEKLPEHMIPSAFILLEKLPLTPSGKIDRQALLASDLSKQDHKQTYLAPRTPIEEIIAGIWTQVLGSDRVSIDDNFFDRGGHSLLATQLISRLRNVFQIELPLRTIFEFPTVEGLAKSIAEFDRSQKGLQTPPLLPVPRNGNLPLSYAQEGLWFIHQLNPNQSVYNSPAAIRLTGSFNLVAFQDTLNEILQRHEILRTSFTVVEGKPVQVIIPNLTLNLPVVDLQHLPETEREREVLRLANQEAKLPFDLTKAPLLRVTLLKLSETEQVALFVMHHIVTDGWSIGILIRELSTLYEVFCSGQTTPKSLPKPSLQYVDYAHWQRQWLQGEVLEKQLSYWKKQLAGAPTTINLEKIAGTTPSTTQTKECAVQTFSLPKELSKKIARLSSQEGVTLFMTLLASFQTLLYRYTKQEDIVVGTDVANRDRPEIEEIMGFFVNLLVLRSDLSGNPTFRELLERVREVTLAAYDRQDFPFAKLVEALRPDRTASITPLFQVLFVLQNVPLPAFELSGLTVNVMELNAGIARFDLALFMQETERGIVGTWKYRTDLFNTEAIARISSHLETLLCGITQNPDTRIDALEMFSESEKQQQIAQKTQRDRAKFDKFKAIKPKAVNLPQKELIKTGYLQPEQKLPYLIQPDRDEIDLADWATSQREFIETKLLENGAILFRGFNLKSVPEFEKVASAICPQLFANYGDLPKEGISDRVYSSTPYPSDRAILFHNESSHLHQYPLKIWFFCVQPAQQGGETPIVDCHKVYQLLNPKLRSRLEEKQLMYVRNYIEGLDVSWQDFFHTTDKTVVEKSCRQSGIDFEWLPNNGLRTRQVRSAVSRHFKTGKPVFFNQVQLHHISCLEPSVRASLLSTLGEENLPRNVYYGDGSPIEDSVMAEIEAVYQEAKVSFPWQQGDILMLDNMLVAHGRNPYQGSRKIVVAMGETISNAILKT
jgi:amino acid adenylation domain-containing protein